MEFSGRCKQVASGRQLGTPDKPVEPAGQAVQLDLKGTHFTSGKLFSAPKLMCHPVC